MELRHRVAAALRGKTEDPQSVSFWLCEGMKKRNVRGTRTQSLETLMHEWEMGPADTLLDPDVHFLNESTGIVVPRGDEIGKYVGDKDVVRLCSGEELQKMIEKFATRDPQVAAELMGPNKSNTPLGAAMSKLRRIGAGNPTMKMIQKTFDDTQHPHDEEAELLERFPEVDPVFESGEVVELSTDDSNAASSKCDMCDVSWPDDATGKNMYRHTRLGLVTHHGCTQFTADVLALHPEITTREALIGSTSTNLSQLNRPGTFHVTVHRAADLPGGQLLGTQAPYAKLSLLPWKEPIQTKPAESGGKHPIWKSMHDNVLTFSHMYNSTITPIPLLEVEIWNSNYLSDDLIACSLLDMTPLLRYPNIEAKRWFTLSSRVQTPMFSRDTSSTGMALPRVLLSIKFVPLEGKYTMGNEHKFRVHQLKSVGLAIPTCAACDRVIVNVLNNVWGYRCETCGIDVHKACIMKAMTKCECKRQRSGSGVDTPPGSAATPADLRDETASSIEDEDKPPVYAKHRDVSYKMLNSETSYDVGRLFVKFDGLHLCSKQCNAASNFHAKNIFDGDTYCRLTLDNVVYETSPVLKSADPMYMERVCFKVRRRRAIFKIEVIDFTSDACIAELKTSLHQLLQRDADAFVRTNPVMRKLRIALHDLSLEDDQNQRVDDTSRETVLTLSDQERFALIPSTEKKSSSGKKKKLGFALISLDYVEGKQDLLCVRNADEDDDLAAVVAETKDFSVESLRATIDRLGRTIKIIRWIDTEYGDIIGWKNKRKSAFCLVIFVVACLWVDLEYVGAYVLFLVIIYMMYQLRLRLEGHLEKRWIDYEAYDLQQEQRLQLHRPIADLLIAVNEAKLSEAMEQQLVRSQVHAMLKDIGAKPYFYVKMKYLPNDKKRSHTCGETLFHASPFGETVIGWTHTVEKSNNPVWRTPTSASTSTPSSSGGGGTGTSHGLLAPPQQKQRKEFPFRNFNVSWRHNAAVCTCERCASWRAAQHADAFTVLQDTCGVDHHAFYFPVPQASRKNFSGRDDVAPWKLFPGLVQFDLCLSLTGEARETPDLIAASGVVSLKDYRTKADWTHEIRVPLTPSGDAVSSTDASVETKEGLDELYVRLELITREPQKSPDKRRSSSRDGSQIHRLTSSMMSSTNTKSISHAEREFSEFVCDSFVEKEKSAVIGQHLFDAFSKVKDTIKTLQNEIDQACGTIASVENLFNWTHPWKSALVLACLIIGMTVLSFIKGRWIVLLFGLTEFGAVFLEDVPPSNTLRKVLWNLITSLPTDQDLIELYEGEREVFLEGKKADQEQEANKKLLLRHHALWAGTIMSKGDSDRSYRSCFLVYRPYRFVLWKSQEDADSGSPPHMQLLFDRMESIIHSHKIDDKSFIFHVFGTTNMGADEKRSFSFDSDDKKEELLRIVTQSCEIPHVGAA